jgi:hypothetical protein
MTATISYIAHVSSYEAIAIDGEGFEKELACQVEMRCDQYFNLKRQ